MRKTGEWRVASVLRHGEDSGEIGLDADGRAGLATSWRGIPLDAVVLSLSVLYALVRPPDAASTKIAVFVTFLLGLYWTIALLGRNRSGEPDTTPRQHTRDNHGSAGILPALPARRATSPGEPGGRAFRAQLAIVLAIIGLVVILPTMVAIGNRHDTAPYRDIHDSPLQIELATGMLLHGQDYYRATYFHTPLAQWWPVGPPNPALYYTDSLPFQEELTAPAMLLARATIGWFDERFIYLLCFGAVLALALSLARTPTTRLALVAGLGLNPLFVPTFISGQNDVLILAEVMGVLALARARRRRSALVLLGVTLATKETALFLLPFLLLWLAGQEQLGAGARVTGRERLAWVACALGWVALPVAILVGPFVVWDAPAFFTSTIGFVEGTVPHSFPIRGIGGYGFASFVLFGRMVRSSAAYWPFGIVQALTAGPVALVLLRRQWRDNTLSRATAGYATTLFLMYYFSRFFHASFIAFTLSLVLLAYFLDPKARTHLSLDFLLLLLVVPQSLAETKTPTLALIAALVMGLLVLYALVEAAMDGWNRAARPAQAARNWRLRVGLALAVLGLLVIWPEGYGIIARHAAHPWNYIHDTPLQAEEAMQVLLAGKDFYAQNYVHTPLAHWYSSPAIAAALYHVDRPPLSIAGSLPFYLLAKATIGWFDERFVLLPLLLLCVALLLRLPAPRELRLAAIAGVLLNPFFIPTLVYGQDDVIVLALLLLLGAALYRGRYRQAALSLGLALATKHTALFMLPPYLIYALARHKGAGDWPARLRATWREVWPALVTPTLICAPFLLWNARAFLDGNIGFLAGTVAHSYPIRGIGTYGFSALVLLGHLVRSPNAYYPFSLWEGAAALPLLVVLARRLWRAPSVRTVFAAYALLLFACYFFSRYFQDSGLAYVISALVLAAIMPAGQPAARVGLEPAPDLSASGREAAEPVAYHRAAS